MAIAPGTHSGIEASFSNPLTTDPFDVPAGTTLVACVCDSDNAGSTNIFTVSNSGTSLSWIERKRSGEVAIYTAYNANTQTGVTVSFATDGGGLDALAMKVLAWSGVDQSSPVGATTSGTSSSNSVSPFLYTSTVDNSRGVYIGNDSNGLGSPTSTDTYDAWTFGSGSGANSSGVVAYKASNTTPASTGVSGNLDAFGTASAAWRWVGIELKPSTAQTITCTGIATAETFGTAQINQTVTVSGIASAEAIGSHELVLQNLVIGEGIESGETFGTPQLVYSQPVTPSSIGSAEAFGSPTIQLGYPQTVSPSGITSEEACGDGPSVVLRHRIVFKPPTVQEQPAARNILLVRYGIHRGITVIRRQDGTFYETRFPDQVTVEEARKVFWGGHVNECTTEEYLALVAAGYGSYLSVEAL